MFEPSERMKRLYELLSQIPPEYDAARRMLEAEKPGEEELAWLAAELVNDTFGEYGDWLYNGAAVAAPGKLHRDYLYQVIELLLEQGLNPNVVLDDEENAMFLLRYTDGPDVAAKIMRLFLEHGGDPNLYGASDNLVSDIEFDMYEYGEYKKPRDEHRVQLTMILQAYGGHWPENRENVTYMMQNGNKAEIFKEFEKYDYFCGDAEGHLGDIHIFNKATGEIVADYI